MSTQNNTKNLNSNIESLSNELKNLRYAVENIFKLICLNAEEIQLLEELSATYNEGIIICHKYFYNILNLEEFCEEMINADLKQFLEEHLFEHLPDEIIEKYELQNVEDSSNQNK